jgi:hypothetical protein
MRDISIKTSPKPGCYHGAKAQEVQGDHDEDDGNSRETSDFSKRQDGFQRSISPVCGMVQSRSGYGSMLFGALISPFSFESVASGVTDKAFDSKKRPELAQKMPLRSGLSRIQDLKTLQSKGVQRKIGKDFGRRRNRPRNLAWFWRSVFVLTAGNGKSSDVL